MGISSATAWSRSHRDRLALPHIRHQALRRNRLGVRGEAKCPTIVLTSAGLLVPRATT